VAVRNSSEEIERLLSCLWVKCTDRTRQKRRTTTWTSTTTMANLCPGFLWAILVHWPLMGGQLHLVQRGGAWAGCGTAQSPYHCTKCNSPPMNGQCTNFILFDVALKLPVPIKGLKYLRIVSHCIRGASTRIRERRRT